MIRTYLSGVKNVAEIANEEQIANVSEIHNKNSMNAWDIQEAIRLVLRYTYNASHIEVSGRYPT